MSVPVNQGNAGVHKWPVIAYPPEDNSFYYSLGIQLNTSGSAGSRLALIQSPSGGRNAYLWRVDCIIQHAAAGTGPTAWMLETSGAAGMTDLVIPEEIFRHRASYPHPSLEIYETNLPALPATQICGMILGGNTVTTTKQAGPQSIWIAQNKLDEIELTPGGRQLLLVADPMNSANSNDKFQMVFHWREVP
jgi:hypothetical protein